MARIKGIDARREAVMQVATLAAAAAYRAPQMSGRLKLQTEIVTGEDQDPILDFFEQVAPISPVMKFDYQTLKYFREKKETLPILLIGADITRSELGWDCGACGFATCGEFNRYSKKNRSRGYLMEGPSCIWKMLDFSAACDFACASVAQNRMDCRAMGTVGLSAQNVGFLPGSSVVIAVPIGPAAEMVYFSRPQNFAANQDEADHRDPMFRTSPTHWMTFPGSGRPMIKNTQDWWENPRFATFEPPSAEEMQFVEQQQQRCVEVCQKHIPEVSKFYQEDSENK